ncbi:LysR family transcriptional regulator [Xylophilus rhododendri]|uniref:LysR family transcriptional regulator n=1 Tax=Xylophilus rhododendri TaxID=2697032 RepID=A0A857J1E7_9BURK|nr:LysR family transcriptional regulator [Xylophilus rhododendri]QHI97734.1 LysR family transcriptional regulator [Xylophilus rhododendri]
MDFYTQLRIFLWAIEAGNFSSAAREHDLAPSTVSKAIAALEARLGVKLFQRGPQAHRVTAEGAAYQPSARAVIDAMAVAESAAGTLAQRVAGVLRIHALPTFAKHQLLRWLPEFLARYPELRVELSVGAQYVDLFDQGVDIAIHSGVLPDSPHRAHRIGASDWLVCAAPSYLARHGEPAVPEDLLRHTCFNFSFASPWNSWSFRRGEGVVVVPVECQASFTQGDMLRELALDSAGIVRLAAFHIGEDLAAGRLVALLGDFHLPMPEPIYLVHAHREQHSPRVRAFVDFLKARVDTQAWVVRQD